MEAAQRRAEAARLEEQRRAAEAAHHAAEAARIAAEEAGEELRCKIIYGIRFWYFWILGIKEQNNSWGQMFVI